MGEKGQKSKGWGRRVFSQDLPESHSFGVKCCFIQTRGDSSQHFHIVRVE